jgi:hypothetical protein
MFVEPRARIRIDASVERVFDLAVSPDTLSRILRPMRPIPGVESIEVLGDGVVAAGTRRRVVLSDRTDLIEEVTVLDRPLRHDYFWVTAPAFPFSLILRGARASWTFTSDGTGTSVEWVYQLQLTTLFVYPVAALVATLFGRWMQSGLERLRDIATG